MKRGCFSRRRIQFNPPPYEQNSSQMTETKTAYYNCQRHTLSLHNEIEAAALEAVERLEEEVLDWVMGMPCKVLSYTISTTTTGPGRYINHAPLPRALYHHHQEEGGRGGGGREGGAHGGRWLCCTPPSPRSPNILGRGAGGRGGGRGRRPPPPIQEDSPPC